MQITYSIPTHQTKSTRRVFLHKLGVLKSAEIAGAAYEPDSPSRICARSDVCAGVPCAPLSPGFGENLYSGVAGIAVWLSTLYPVASIPTPVALDICILLSCEAIPVELVRVLGGWYASWGARTYLSTSALPEVGHSSGLIAVIRV